MSQKLIEAVKKGLILTEQIVVRSGRYKVSTIISVSQGARNTHDGYWVRVREVGGFESHDSFYGKPSGEPYKTAEDAAKGAIIARNIISAGGGYAAFKRRSIH